MAGQVFHHQFHFTNTGQQALELKSVRSTCGCATSTGWTARVEPGQSGVIPIELHTIGLDGVVERLVNVVSTDPVRPTVALTVKAEVWHPIRVSPPSAGIRIVGESSSNHLATVRLTNQETAPLTMSLASCEPASIRAELKTIEASRVFELEVRPQVTLGVGNVFGKVTLQTSSTNSPLLTVPVWIIVQPALTVLPEQFKLPAVASATAVTQDVSIRCLGTTPLVLSPEPLELPNVALQLVELQPGKLFTARLVFPAHFQLPTNKPAELRIRSNQPQAPLLKIPITITRDP